MAVLLSLSLSFQIKLLIFLLFVERSAVFSRCARKKRGEEFTMGQILKKGQFSGNPHAVIYFMHLGW